jgi:hypothetical protein
MEDLKELQDGYMECANNMIKALIRHSVLLGKTKANIIKNREKLQDAKDLEMAFFYTSVINEWTSAKMYWEDLIQSDIEAVKAFMK